MSHKLRMATAAALERSNPEHISCLVGFDGFVDEIVRVVDKRDRRNKPLFVPTIHAFSERLARAAGKSTNIEMTVQKVKLGGNGPILANALMTFGLKTTYIGSLGHPAIHPVFKDFAAKARVYSVAEPGSTNALEFDDGKIMLGKYESLQNVNYENIIKIVGHARFAELWQSSRLISMVNWTMIGSMTALWAALLAHQCRERDAAAPPQTLFFDLADPEKRTQGDISECLQTLSRFAQYFNVIFGCNEKESLEISRVLGVPTGTGASAELQERAAKIRQQLGIDCVVIHPVKCAAAASPDGTAFVAGPFTPRPIISTGAGDHFNAGFCLGCILEFSIEQALLCGVAASGFYVRHAVSPTIADVAAFLRNWPEPS